MTNLHLGPTPGETVMTTSAPVRNYDPDCHRQAGTTWAIESNRSPHTGQRELAYGRLPCLGDHAN